MEEEKKEEPDLDKELVINEKYKILYRLGKGGFSKVYLVKNIHDSKKYQ
jgi:serine/threonine protein kinase